MFLPEWLVTQQQTAASPVVIVSKTAYSWGNNWFGVLGIGDTINRSSPIQIGTSSWVMVSAGQSHSIGITATGGLFTWGAAVNGELGNGATLGDRSSPIAIGSSSWTKVAAGWNISFAIRTDGGLFAWGVGTAGKLGTGSTAQLNSPNQIGTSSWIQVSTNKDNGFAITTNNTLFGWGVSSLLGGGNTIGGNRSNPVQIIALPRSLFTQVSVGVSGSMAISNDGIGHFWGVYMSGGVFYNYGIPGGDQNGTYNFPTVFTSFLTETNESDYITATGKTQLSWLQLEAGQYSVLGLRSDKKLFIWGNNTEGNLGRGTSLASNQLYAPNMLTPESNYNFISAGGDGARARWFAISTDGILYSWGNNFAGSLGVGDTIRRLVPTAVNITSSFVFVNGGIFSTAAISTDGKLFTWGQGTNGALGNGTTTGNVLNPTQIGSSSWYQVKVGYNFMGGITGAYKLFYWGIGNGSGDGTGSSRSVPTAIGSSSWIFIGVGNSCTFGIRSDSTLWAWGNNYLGVLGLGDTISRSSPVQIASPANWKYVDPCRLWSGGIAQNFPWRAYGIASDNTLYVWGYPQSGQAGTISTNYSAPVQMSASQFSAVSAGFSSTVAIRLNKSGYYYGVSDQNIWAPYWYANQASGAAAPKPLPANFESWIMVATNESHSAMIRSDYKLFVVGRDDWGQLGLGTSLVTRSYPTQVGSSSWTQVAVGAATTFAIDSRGRLFSWGLNDLGSAGVNSAVSYSSPVQIGSSSWTMVSSDRNHVIALRA